MNPEELFKMIENKIAQDSRESKDIQEIYEPKLRTFERNINLFQSMANALVLGAGIGLVLKTLNPIFILLQWSTHIAIFLISFFTVKAYGHSLVVEKLKTEINRGKLNEKL